MSAKNTSIVIAEEIIISKIYNIRGKQVMIDSDLAELYGVDTRRLNEQVKRNAERFPDDLFQLSVSEFADLKSQFATSRWGGRRKLPNVFTEHGVLMLSGVLNSDFAIKVNIQIVRVYSKIRSLLANNTEILSKFDRMEAKDEQKTRRKIGFRASEE